MSTIHEMTQTIVKSIGQIKADEEEWVRIFEQDEKIFAELWPGIKDLFYLFKDEYPRINCQYQYPKSGIRIRDCTKPKNNQIWLGCDGLFYEFHCDEYGTVENILYWKEGQYFGKHNSLIEVLQSIILHMQKHFEREKNILFPKEICRSVLSAEFMEKLAKFMAFLKQPVSDLVASVAKIGVLSVIPQIPTETPIGKKP